MRNILRIILAFMALVLSMQAATYQATNIVDGTTDVILQNADGTLLSGGIVALGYFSDGYVLPTDTRESGIVAAIGNFTTVASGISGSYSSTLGGSFAGYVDGPLVMGQSITGVDALINRSLYVFVGNAATLTASNAFAIQKVGSFADDEPLENIYTAILGGAPSIRIGTVGSYTGNAAGQGISAHATLQLVPEIFPPSIISQPVGGYFDAGTLATVSITVTGTAPFTYQWLKGGVAITGANSSSLSITNFQSVNEGDYTCNVTNACGSVLSNPAKLALNQLKITQQPVDQSPLVGETVVLSTVATDSPSRVVSYQWRKGAVIISGATNSSITLNNVQLADAGAYSCIVSDSNTDIISNKANITVYTTPSIGTQPISQTVVQGNNVNFSVVAAGTVASPLTPTPTYPALTYQWQRNSTNIQGANGSAYSISSASSADAGNYKCVVTGYKSSTATSASTATSVEAYLTVNVPVSIINQPIGQTVNKGANVTFSVSASGTPSISYTWKRNGIGLINGINISGATSATLTLTNIQEVDAGNYTCTVDNVVKSPVTSLAAVLTVNVPVSIINQPISQTVNKGANVTFSVSASGTPSISYTWKRNGISLINGTNISGSTGAILTLTNVQESDAGNYTCTVNNVVGISVASSVAVLTVNVPPYNPSIIPINTVVVLGDTVVFSVSVSGTSPMSYQWKVNGTNISNGVRSIGVNSSTLTITNVQVSDAGSYTCVITNVAGFVISPACVLTVNVPPSVLLAPADTSVFAGINVTLSISAGGTNPLSYQWKKNGKAIAGATGVNLSLSRVGFIDEASYSCVVSNVVGSVTSAAAKLTVKVDTSSPDTDGDTVSDSLETYLAVLGFDSATDSADALVRLKAVVPILGEFYTRDQMKGLALGHTVLEPVSGKFRLTLELNESSDLSTWTSKAVSAGDVTIDNNGKLGVDILPANAKAKFYRLQGQ